MKEDPESFYSDRIDNLHGKHPQHERFDPKRERLGSKKSPSLPKTIINVISNNSRDLIFALLMVVLGIIFTEKTCESIKKGSLMDDGKINPTEIQGSFNK